MSLTRITVDPGFVALLASVFLIAGCGDGSDDARDTQGDIGRDGDLADASFTLTPPDPPVFTPCPAGWREMPGSADWLPATCEPWPAGGAQACAGDEAHFPGEPSCRPIGSPCPDGLWASDFPDDQTIAYVQAGAPPGGSGTEESPYSTIADALENTSSPAVIALSKGVFDEVVSVPSGVTLWGACVDQTVVTSTAPSASDAVITSAGSGVALRNLQVNGLRPGLSFAGGASVDIRDVLIADTRDMAFQIVASTVTGGGVVIRDTQPGQAPWAIGVAVSDGAAVALERVVIDGVTGVGVVAEDLETSLSLSQVAIRNSHMLEGLADDVVAGTALLLADASVELAAGVLECNTLISVIGSGAKGSLSLSEMVIRGDPPEGACDEGPGMALDPETDEAYGVIGGEQLHFGVIMQNGSTLTATRTLFDSLKSEAIDFLGGREADISDSLIRNTSHGSFFRLAVGMLVFQVADDRSDDTPQTHAVLNRVVFSGNQGISLVSAGDNAQIEANDVVIDSSEEMACQQSSCEEPYGVGLSAIRGGRASLSHFQVSDSALCGVQVADAGQVTLSHGLVAHNRIGINVQVADYDFDQLSEDVYYLDNERNLDSEALPVPNPADFFF